MREFEVAARDAKRECVCRSMIGMIQIERGNLNEAIDALDARPEGEDPNPEQETVLEFEVAACYETKKATAKALEFYQKAARRDPGVPRRAGPDSPAEGGAEAGRDASGGRRRRRVRSGVRRPAGRREAVGATAPQLRAPPPSRSRPPASPRTDLPLSTSRAASRCVRPEAKIARNAFSSAAIDSSLTPRRRKPHLVERPHSRAVPLHDDERRHVALDHRPRGDERALADANALRDPRRGRRTSRSPRPHACPASCTPFAIVACEPSTTSCAT